MNQSLSILSAREQQGLSVWLINKRKGLIRHVEWRTVRNISSPHWCRSCGHDGRQVCTVLLIGGCPHWLHEQWGPYTLWWKYSHNGCWVTDVINFRFICAVVSENRDQSRRTRYETHGRSPLLANPVKLGRTIETEPLCDKPNCFLLLKLFKKYFHEKVVGNKVLLLFRFNMN